MPPTFPPREDPSALTREDPIAFGTSQPTADASTPLSPQPVRRNPSRAARHQDISRLDPDPRKKSYEPPSRLCRFLPLSLLATLVGSTTGISSPAAHLLHAQSRSFDPVTQHQEDFHPGLIQSPFALKAKASKDPDLPSLKESLTGPHAEHFWLAMDAEIQSLESKGTWEVVDCSSMPSGVKAIPGTWAQRIK